MDNRGIELNTHTHTHTQNICRLIIYLIYFIKLVTSQIKVHTLMLYLYWIFSEYFIHNVLHLNMNIYTYKKIKCAFKKTDRLLFSCIYNFMTVVKGLQTPSLKQTKAVKLTLESRRMFSLC